MLYHFSKILQELVYPFNVALILLVAGQWWLWRGRVRRGAVAAALATVILAISGLPSVSESLLAGLESVYPARPINEYPDGDAIVVLGGTTPPTRSPRFEPEELGGSRLLQAARLYQAGKARRIIVTGGLGYPNGRGAERTEADDMAEILTTIGVPPDDILRESESRNTFENAVHCARRFIPHGVRKILLVTAASHMPRAAALFERQGFEVIAIPTGFRVVEPTWSFRRLLPTPGNVVVTTAAIKERVGYAAYRILGQL
jgi:uncharacterized SAM-binding protein YcdF (DUF218 family)